MKPFLYALSTCFHCKRTKKWLNDNNIDYDFVDVDLAEEKEKRTLVEKVKEMTGAAQFPVVTVEDDYVVGFNEEGLKKLLGV